MRAFKTEGIIIKRKNYGESDRLITLLSKYRGKLLVKASGIRKITSRRSAHLELLNHTHLTIHQNNGYAIVTEAESINDYSAIKNNLQKMGAAYHLCELIDRLCPEGEQNPQVFDLIVRTLQTINDSEPDGKIMHGFEVALLMQLGFWHGQAEVSDKLDTDQFIEGIIEKRLRSKRIFSKLQ